MTADNGNRLIGDLARLLSEHPPAGVGRADADQIEALLRVYYRHISPADLEGCEAVDLLGGLVAHWQLMRSRRPGRTRIRVYNPDQEEHGWRSSHTVIEIVTDDMPFLVDSASWALNRRGLTIHLTLHPVFAVVRDNAGKLTGLHDPNSPVDAAMREAVMRLHVDRQPAEQLADIERLIGEVLTDVRAATSDWLKMRQLCARVEQQFGAATAGLPSAGGDEAKAFLTWMYNDHFLFLATCTLTLPPCDGRDGNPEMRVQPDSGLGLLGPDAGTAGRADQWIAGLGIDIAEAGEELMITKANARSTVHRPAYMDLVAIKQRDEQGCVVGLHCFVGLFSSAAYSTPPRQIPLLRTKIAAVMAGAQVTPHSHSGRVVANILDNFPRDTLFQISTADLLETTLGVLGLQERQRTRLFVVRDPLHRFYSCLVYLPRERYSLEVRTAVQQILVEALQGVDVVFETHFSESILARIFYFVVSRPGSTVEYDIEDLQRRIVAVTTSWSDGLREALNSQVDEVLATRYLAEYGAAFTSSYRDDFHPRIAVGDIQRIEQIREHGRIGVHIYHPLVESPDQVHVRLYALAQPVPLSQVIPVLEHMGLRVHGERPYRIRHPAGDVWIHDFSTVRPVGTQPIDAVLAARFTETFLRVWESQADDDGFNGLVLRAGLTWREALLFRAYSRYQHQIRVQYTQEYMVSVLNRHPVVVQVLARLFGLAFDPKEAGHDEDAAETRTRFENLLNEVESLDEDVILRRFLGLIDATLRTNFYCRDADGSDRDYVSFKFDPHRIEGTPKPLPMFEIFVFARHMEGVHLRGGRVARGGLRWSDRMEDYRTEILGLMKAQMVKNTVIVPVGAKGGFVVKQPPASQDREAFMAEGVACYRIFINGLLDVTDNLDGGRIVPPSRVVRHDPDDSYLVVAADKGTATFSDIANAISGEHGFWMGDAFASGGSKGYDHKKMGITARGAWESVKRHFRALGKDCQNEAFTCVGVGDMSGDVFGNGMLLSRHIKLLAAFDHRHIFLDPTPDVAASYAERERMFALPRSSWDDYDRKLISAGGGIFPRSAKVITLSPQIRAVLDIEAEQLSPVELIRAILGAPVELLWNGGIGTYVKAESETNADVGDRANNANRLNGNQLRCKIVGEGGNLGLTQRGRIEAAQSGVLLNTDAIDNSAGVDTSDHEVNIKILLNLAIAGGALAPGERDDLLVAMTDEVADLVIFDNYRQNLAISLMRALSIDRIGAKQHFVRWLEQQGLLDRQLEFLPSEEEFNERRARGLGLTRPELAVLLAYSKIHAYNSLLDSAVPEDPYLSKELALYFPTPLRERFANEMQAHPLRREIIATQVTNSMVNRMGATFVLRMQEDTGQSVAEVAKAYTIAREVLRARELWAEIDRLGDSVDFHRQIDLLLRIWNLMRNMTRWLLNAPGAASDIAQSVERYTGGFEQLLQVLPRAVSKADAVQFQNENRALQSLGYSEAFAQIISQLPALVAAFDIIEVAFELDCQVERAAKAYFSIGEQLHLKWLAEQIEKLPVEGRWHAHARGVLRDELYAQHRALTAQALRRCSKPKQDPLQAWAEGRESALSYTQTMFGEMHALVSMDYPTVSVGVRRLSQLVAIGAA